MGEWPEDDDDVLEPDEFPGREEDDSYLLDNNYDQDNEPPGGVPEDHKYLVLGDEFPENEGEWISSDTKF